MDKILLIDSSNIMEVRKNISKNQGRKIVLVAKDEEFNRKIMETTKKITIFGFELQDSKDKLRERNSGLNQVLCKLAKENEISIGIDLSFLSEYDDKSTSLLISRIKQNVSLCRKYKVNMATINANKLNLYDLKAFLLTLGMTTIMVKYATDNILILNR